MILAHNYMTPQIFHGVADLVGDSLALAYQAVETPAEVIVLCGVHFMAETAKIVSPQKTVLIPDLKAGCSLAASITGADIRLLRERYPGVPVVTYVNTSADVKAESDICCTSSNAVEVVKSLGVPRVIFLPDEYLGNWVASQTAVELILWKGHCEVHERFTGAEIAPLPGSRSRPGGAGHPECPPEVLAEADFVGSTGAMNKYVGQKKPARVVMITECSMSDNVAVDNPDVQFVRPCNLCPHMQRITLAEDPAVARNARIQSRGRTSGGRQGAHWRSNACCRSAAGGRDESPRHPSSATETLLSDVVVIGSGVAGLEAASRPQGAQGFAAQQRRPRRHRLEPVGARRGGGGARRRRFAPPARARHPGGRRRPVRHQGGRRAHQRRGPKRVRELAKSGAHFDRDEAGQLLLGQEAAHQRRRILHAHGDATGAEMVRALAARARRCRPSRLSSGSSRSTWRSRTTT